MTPEELARLEIDKALRAAGWAVQDRRDLNPRAALGVAVREFPLEGGEADYLLFAEGRAIGVVEAKPVGTTLSGVAEQTRRYLGGLPASLVRHADPLPFGYESTGKETQFVDLRDPESRSRRVFSFHRPETLLNWVRQTQTLRARLGRLPPIARAGLRDCQLEAVEGLEASLAQGRPKALIQMATGAGKTYTAVTASYRLIKYAGVRRILFLVDRGNLGRQTLREFQGYTPPDDPRKFTELYNVQNLTSNRLDPEAKVTITTIQRLYSMLKGEPNYDPAGEERSAYEVGMGDEVIPVEYSPTLPPEYFDLILVDECHRSIYKTWKQVLEYFDAFIVGLTATPSKLTFGFFNRNLVSEYSYERSVAEGVNVGFDVYRIRTEVGQGGARLEASPEYLLGRRDKATREVRWEGMDEDLVYKASDLDRAVVAVDQIRTVIRTFRDRLFTDLFPGRQEVPKTLIFAKDDSHAEDIVNIVREEFGKGNDFAKKITYSADNPEQLIKDFRTAYYPRIAVTVDMISTGTDIKPLECLLFMRDVKSRIYYEQMKGRGTRSIDPSDLQSVSADARHKTHFVLVDAVGVTESFKEESQPLERKKSVPFDKLMERIVMGEHTEANLTSLASRLSRLAKEATPADLEALRTHSGGLDLHQMAARLLNAVDPDQARELAQQTHPDPSEAALKAAAEQLVYEATAPIYNPELRQALNALQRRSVQTLDILTQDRLTYFGPAQHHALELTQTFRQFLEQHKDEITALQILLNQPQAQQRVSFRMVKELAAALAQSNPQLTPEVLWAAFERLNPERVRRSRPERVLTDLISLVRFALEQEALLRPYPETVAERFEAWLARQPGRFTEEQTEWLRMMADHIATSLSVEEGDLDLTPFQGRGGSYRARKLFGPDLERLMHELTEALAA
ncbi:MAG: DEAD/DEAH box helicase family protein [Thermaceae bacterium]|nr:DEAD/DEAH box helicase family protein [Thermaceae bacterium]